MPRTADIHVTCLRVSELNVDWARIATSMQGRWRLDQLPQISVTLAKPGHENGLHIARVDATLSKGLADTLDAPWGIEGLAEQIVSPLRAALSVHEVVFVCKVLDAVSE